MKKSILTLSAMALAVSLGAQANTTGDVQVGGSISPSPCAVSLSRASFDLGSFLRDELPELAEPLEIHKEVLNAFTINMECSADTTFVLYRKHVIDSGAFVEGNFEGKSYPAYGANFPTPDDYWRRLDANSTAAYAMRFSDGVSRPSTFPASGDCSGPAASTVIWEGSLGTCFTLSAGTPVAQGVDIAAIFDKSEISVDGPYIYNLAMTFEVAY